MSKAKALLKLIEQNDNGGSAPSADSIQTSLADRLVRLGFEGVSVDNVDVDYEGNITVDFADSTQNIMTVLFFMDNTNATAIVLDDDGEELLSFDLDPLAPATLQTDFGLYLDMLNLTWLNRSTMGAIFSAGEEMDVEVESPDAPNLDAYGNVIAAPSEANNTHAIFRALTHNRQANARDAASKRSFVVVKRQKNGKIVPFTDSAFYDTEEEAQKQREYWLKLNPGSDIRVEPNQGSYPRLAGPNEARTVRQGKRKMRAPVLSSVKRHSLPMKVHAAIARMPKKARKHSMKTEARITVTIHTDGKNRYVMLMQDTATDWSGVEMDAHGKITNDYANDDDIDGTLKHVASMDDLPDPVKAKARELYKDWSY